MCSLLTREDKGYVKKDLIFTSNVESEKKTKIFAENWEHLILYSPYSSSVCRVFFIISNKVSQTLIINSQPEIKSLNCELRLLIVDSLPLTVARISTGED